MPLSNLREFMSANWFLSLDKNSDILFEILELEKNWQSAISPEKVELSLDFYVEQLLQVLDGEELGQQSLYRVLDAIYDELAFSGPGMQQLPESALSSLSYCISARTGNHMTLAVVVSYLLKQLGFNAFIAELESDVTLVVMLNNAEMIVVDSITGATEYLITSDDLNESFVNGLASFAKPVPNDELIKEIISEQKLCLLAEGHLEEALACVETMMEMLPEDPYERRDRGIVLQQLDCEQWAKEDLKYFIKACPNDPMASFFKMQLEEQVLPVHTIH